MFLFSWPAIKQFITYTQDESTIDVNEIYFANFLTEVAKAAPNKIIHIVAHSMGNRALLRTINKGIFLAANKQVKFGQIILAAADVDAELFSQYSEKYVASSNKTTVYLSPYDNAVGMSQLIHGHARLGCGINPPESPNPRIDYIISTIPSDFPAHAYVAENVDILDDLQSLFQFGIPLRSSNAWTRLNNNSWKVGPPDVDPSRVKCKLE